MAVTLARIRQLPGIGEITGDLSTNTLVVNYDPNQVAIEAIIQAVEETGFTVEGQFEP